MWKEPDTFSAENPSYFPRGTAAMPGGQAALSELNRVEANSPLPHTRTAAPRAAKPLNLTQFAKPETSDE
jgi:hypothetical protein